MHKLPKTHEEWLNDRMKGIGGSDVGAVLGLNKYKSAYTLWAEKCGLLPNEEVDNEAMRVGRDLEQYVADRFMEATGKKVVTSDYSFQSEAHPFMLANVDRLLVGEEVGLECKTASALTRCDFENGDIPPSYYCQCMHYMAVTGFKKWYIAILVMGKGFYWYEINRNEEEIQALIEAEQDFWNCVESGEAPEVDASESTKDTLNLRWQSQEKECILGHEAEDSVKELLSIKKRTKALKELQTAYENVIKSEMEEAEFAEVENATIKWKTSKSMTFDRDKFKKENPELYKKYLKETTSRKFYLKEKKEC
jgi:putative phage-type endonuclease